MLRLILAQNSIRFPSKPCNFDIKYDPILQCFSFHYGPNFHFLISEWPWNIYRYDPKTFCAYQIFLKVYSKENAQEIANAKLQGWFWKERNHFREYFRGTLLFCMTQLFILRFHNDIRTPRKKCGLFKFENNLFLGFSNSPRGPNKETAM